jgi:hypothetical protein
MSKGRVSRVGDVMVVVAFGCKRLELREDSGKLLYMRREDMDIALVERREGIYIVSVERREIERRTSRCLTSALLTHKCYLFLGGEQCRTVETHTTRL